MKQVEISSCCTGGGNILVHIKKTLYCFFIYIFSLSFIFFFLFILLRICFAKSNFYMSLYYFVMFCTFCLNASLWFVLFTRLLAIPKALRISIPPNPLFPVVCYSPRPMPHISHHDTCLVHIFLYFPPMYHISPLPAPCLPYLYHSPYFL